jgi:DNA-binding NarL/FixJ family response regulator
MSQSILIAVENALLSSGIEQLLNQQGYEQFQATYCLNDAVEAIEQHHPTMMILSERLQLELDVLTLVEQLQPYASTLPILLIGRSQNGHTLQELVLRGNCSYLFWYDSFESSLQRAIISIQQGRIYLSPTAQSEYLAITQQASRPWRFSPRARTVLHLLAEGCHVKQIAWQQSISVRQVYGLQRRLRNYFGASTTAQMLVRAAEEGFIPFSG